MPRQKVLKLMERLDDHDDVQKRLGELQHSAGSAQRDRES